MIHLSEPKSAAEIFARRRTRARLPWMQHEDARKKWNEKAARERQERDRADLEIQKQAASEYAIRENALFDRLVELLLTTPHTSSPRRSALIAASFRSPLSIRGIQSFVAGEYQVNLDDLLGPRRGGKLPAARQMAYYLCCKIRGDLSIASIARLFDRDHTTLLSAKKVIESKPAIMERAAVLTERLLAESKKREARR